MALVYEALSVKQQCPKLKMGCTKLTDPVDNLSLVII